MAAEWPGFSLDESLRTGLVPLVVDGRDPADTLLTYVGLARVRAERERHRENAEVGRKTTEGFISVLEDLLLAYRVPVFTRRAKRATAAHPKLCLFDAGASVRSDLLVPWTDPKRSKAGRVGDYRASRSLVPSHARGETVGR